MWRESPDFVRLAARVGATIVPFAAVGADDAYDTMMETQQLIEHPVLGPLLTAALGRADPSLTPAESLLPLTRLPLLGLPSPIPLPNLQRIYFKFSPAIDTLQHAGVDKDPEAAQRLYDGIKAQVEGGMAELLAYRATDPNQHVGQRLGRSLSQWLPALSFLSLPAPAGLSPRAGTRATSVADAVGNGSVDTTSANAVSGP